MTLGMDLQCNDELMQQVLAMAGEDSQRGVDAIEALLNEYPEDPRLHFLKGSLLIGLKRFIGAHQAMQKAVEIAPGFDIARFQLGFFELTSGEADTAIATWQPLKNLPAVHYLHSFVDGLEHLAADRFELCIECLLAGIAANQENLPLNGDMELIIQKCAELVGGRPNGGVAEGSEEVSVTSLLLGESSLGNGRRKN